MVNILFFPFVELFFPLLKLNVKIFLSCRQFIWIILQEKETVKLKVTEIKNYITLSNTASVPGKQIQRSQIRVEALPDILRSSEPGRGSTQHSEDK
jgi:hypothetical protein